MNCQVSWGSKNVKKVVFAFFGYILLLLDIKNFFQSLQLSVPNFHSIPSCRRDRVYKLKICLSVCLSVCLSSLQDFEYRPFISSQDHARPHILYTDGQRMMSAVIWRCQWHTQRQIQRQIHRQRQIQSASKTQCMLYF